MKKGLIFLLLMLLTFSVSASADMQMTAQERIELPERIYDYSSAMFAAEPTALQRLYAYLEQELSKGAAEIDVSRFRIQVGDTPPSNADITFKEFTDIFCSVVYNNPQLCSLRTAYRYTYFKSTGTMASLKPVYSSECDMERFNIEVDRVLSKCIAPGMTDIEKLLSLHDYLADNTDYISDDDYSYTAYGALVNKKAVCQGYSLAYKLLCNRIGIDCGYAITDESANHMWNVVCLDDEYYNIDVTWDDATTRVSYKNQIYILTDNIMHKHFLNNDEQCQTNHKYTYKNWVSDRPECIDGELFQNLPYKDENARMEYYKGSFWYKQRQLVLNSENNMPEYAETGRLYRLDGDKLVRVNESEYLPDIQLQCRMYNVFDNILAISGAAGQRAVLYSVEYDNGTLVSVSEIKIVFDENGEFIADIGDYSKIMLLDGITPLAYAVEQ